MNRSDNGSVVRTNGLAKPVVRYISIGSIQLGPISIRSTSMPSRADIWGSDRDSTLVPWRSDFEDDASYTNRLASIFASLII